MNKSFQPQTEKAQAEYLLALTEGNIIPLVSPQKVSQFKSIPI